MSNGYSLSSDDPDNFRGHAYVHDTQLRNPKLKSLLDGFVTAGLGVHQIEGTKDPCYAMMAARVRALHTARASGPCHLLLTGFPTTAINYVEIADVVSIATNTGRGLLFELFEDW